MLAITDIKGTLSKCAKTASQSAPNISVITTSNFLGPGDKEKTVLDLFAGEMLEIYIVYEEEPLRKRICVSLPKYNY